MGRKRRKCDIIVYVDGLCEPRNPGGWACWGFVVYRDGEPVTRQSGTVGSGRGVTGNLAEYAAAIEALGWLSDQGILGRVEVRSDSQLLVYQMQGIYAVRSSSIVPLHRMLRRIASRFRSISWRWIPRELNGEADALSREAYSRAIESHLMEKARQLSVVPGPDGALLVESSRKDMWYSVRLAPEESCECPAFMRGMRPCKHILAARMSDG